MTLNVRHPGTLGSIIARWRGRFMASDPSHAVRTHHAIRGVAFDGFDTLVRIGSDLRVFQRLCQHVGAPFSALPMTRSVTLADFAESLGVSDSRFLLALEADLATEIDSIEPFADAFGTLRALRQRGFVLALASNATGRHADRLADLCRDHVDVLQISCHVGAAKPSSTFFELLSRSMNLAPEHLLMVGDNAELDVKAAIDNRLHAVQVVRADPRSYAAWICIERLGALVEFLNAPDSRVECFQ